MMMKKIYIFFKEDLLIGGTELLIERVSRNLVNDNEKVVVVSKSVMPEMQMRYKKNNLAITIVNKWEQSDIVQVLNGYDDYYIRAITFSIEDFCMVKAYYKTTIKTLLYTVYFNQLIIGGKTKNKIALNLVKKISAKILGEMFASKNIVCMDEHTVENTYNYYKNKISFDKKNIPYLRIPVDIVEYEKEDIIERSLFKVNCILTIARADFPWKGYILGLMDYVAQNCQNNNLELCIVTYGAGENLIKSKFDSFDSTIKERITILGKTDYDELESLYSNAKIYVGQGTTVLDAAQRGIITIPVVPDTYSVLAEDYFHDNPTRVTVPTDTQNNFEELIEKVCKMSSEEYLKLATKGRDLVIGNYGTVAICNGIRSLFQDISDNSHKSLYVWLFNKSKQLKQLLRRFQIEE